MLEVILYLIKHKEINSELMLFEKIENLVMLIKRKKQYKEMGEMRKGHASQGPSSSFSLASLSS